MCVLLGSVPRLILSRKSPLIPSPFFLIVTRLFATFHPSQPSHSSLSLPPSPPAPRCSHPPFRSLLPSSSHELPPSSSFSAALRSSEQVLAPFDLGAFGLMLSAQLLKQLPPPDASQFWAGAVTYTQAHTDASCTHTHTHTRTHTSHAARTYAHTTNDHLAYCESDKANQLAWTRILVRQVCFVLASSNRCLSDTMPHRSLNHTDNEPLLQVITFGYSHHPRVDTCSVSIKQLKP